MYRLLIVDDEEIIVNGLYEIFTSMPNEDLDIYKAYSGAQAMQWMSRTRIDILLTDIRMPEIDGLQLMEAMKRNWPQCRIIFLTGHSEFDYIYKAIQYPGINYILKTEDNEKIIDAVHDAVQEIKRDVQIEDLIHQAKEQMNKTLEVVQQDYINHLIQGDARTLPVDIQFKQLDIPMHPHWPIYLLLGKQETAADQILYTENIERMQTIRQVLIRFFATQVNYLITLDTSYNLVAIIQPKEVFSQVYTESIEIPPCYTELHRFMHGILETIQNICRETVKLPISFTTSTTPCSWDKVHEKYQNLVHLSNYRISDGVEVLASDNIPVTEAKDSAVNAKETESLIKALHTTNIEMLMQLMERGQNDEFFLVLDRLLAPMRTLPSMQSELGLECYYTIALAMLAFVNRWKLVERLPSPTTLNKLLDVAQLESWNQAADDLHMLATQLFKMQRAEQSNRANSTVAQLQKYIFEHVGEDLSLVRLSELVYMNPSYLSRIYKNETGVNLSEFIEQARLTRAKELLSNSSMKGYEVAKAIGYDSVASFSRFFKRITRQSPQEYREQQRK